MKCNKVTTMNFEKMTWTEIQQYVETEAKKRLKNEIAGGVWVGK